MAAASPTFPLTADLTEADPEFSVQGGANPTGCSGHNTAFCKNFQKHMILRKFGPWRRRSPTQIRHYLTFLLSVNYFCVNVRLESRNSSHFWQKSVSFSIMSKQSISYIQCLVSISVTSALSAYENDTRLIRVCDRNVHTDGTVAAIGTITRAAQRKPTNIILSILDLSILDKAFI